MKHTVNVNRYEDLFLCNVLVLTLITGKSRVKDVPIPEVFFYCWTGFGR